MATTSQLLTWVELEAHGWQREGPRGSRAMLNEAQRLLLTKETEQNVIYDTSTGNLPYFETSSGVYQYTCPDNVWRIGGVLVDIDNFSKVFTNDYDLAWNNIENLYEETRVGGMRYYRLRPVRTYDYTRNQNARILFNANPGDTTNCYRRLAWRLPTEISSDSVQHEMPGAADIDYLLPATMKLIDAINDHAKLNDARLYIMQVLKPAMWKEMDGGEQGVSSFCVKRKY